MQAKFTTTSAYPSERAFVLQFHREADLGAGRFLGRIEHVASGRVGHIQSLEELVAVIAAKLGEVETADPSSTHSNGSLATDVGTVEAQGGGDDDTGTDGGSGGP